MKNRILGLLAIGLMSSQAQAVTYHWSIEKYGDVDQLTLTQGQQFLVNWTVVLTHTQTGLDDLQNYVDECINVTDDLLGTLGTICYDNGITFTYSNFVGPYATDGFYSVTNTSTFVAADTGATGSDSWTVRVQVGEPAQVPEPGTLALLGISLAGLGLSRRRKSN